MPLYRVGAHDDWPTLGWEVIDFVEAYCVHGPGDIQGEPFLLDIEEVQLVLDLYRLYPRGHQRGGRRVVARGVYSRSKGRRKSELAGALVVAEARGPVRFDGWRRDGKAYVPVGRPVQSPFIRCLATEEGQAGNTYDNVTAMLDHAAEHHHDVFAGVDIGRTAQTSTRVILGGGGEIRPSTASSAAKDGGKETFAVGDEIHLYVLPENRAMHRTVSRNLVKRKLAEPWMLDTTTSYRPGQRSVAETAHERAQSILDGKTKRTAGFYWNHREGLPVEDWNDDAQVLASLREAYGEASEWLDLERMLTDEIRNPEAEEADSRRYFCNQVYTYQDTWMSKDVWTERALDEELERGDAIALGFDGAQYEDSTVLVACRMSDGHLVALGAWEKPRGPEGDGWETPRALVRAAVREAFERYTVARMYCDPKEWRSEIDDWRGTYGDKVVVEFDTNRPKQMSEALERFHTAAITGQLTHAPGAELGQVLTTHVLNARKTTSLRGGYLAIRKPVVNGREKIDGAVSAVLAYEARGDAIAAGWEHSPDDVIAIVMGGTE
jgi:phage terminase large subunit-like protein